MRIYLAARYSRRLELCDYRRQLHDMGHVVQARWLDGGHQISASGTPIGGHGEALVEGDDGSTDVRSADLRAKFANDDLQDVMSADCIISFTEPPRSGHSRGGRHVEFGLALARRCQSRIEFPRLIVVGHRENIFHWLDCVEFYETTAALLGQLRHELAIERLKTA